MKRLMKLKAKSLVILIGFLHLSGLQAEECTLEDYSVAPNDSFSIRVWTQDS